MRGSRNPPAPTKNSRIRTGYWSFCFICFAKGEARVDSNSNSDDRCLRQKRGGAVGAAASRMRVPPKARSSRWEPRPGLLILRGLRNPPAPTKKPQRIQVQGILVRLAFDFPSAFEILTVGLFSCISICCSCFIRFIFARLTLKQKTRVVKPFG